MGRQRRRYALARLPAQMVFRFDAAAGRQLAEAGMEQALFSAVGLPWKERAERWLATRREPFTADHLIAAS
jgi:hypothetical protein